MKPGQIGLGHPHIDAHVLDMARIAARRIDEDRSLLAIAYENLERERRLHGGLSRASREWETILSRPWTEVKATLIEESDEGQRLRSSQPFAGIVTEEARLEMMDRHPPPWPMVRFDPARVPPEVMAAILADWPRYA